MNQVLPQYPSSKPRYSQSELQLFLKCGKQWEFRYVRGLKLAPRGAMTLGSAIDRAVSANLVQKIRSRVDLGEREALEIYSDDFDRRAGETEWRDEEPGEQKDLGVALLKAHHEVVAPAIDPETVQERFLLETSAGYELAGVIDFTERGGVIGDTKTSRTAYDPGAARRALQPALYDLAYEALRGRPSAGFRYDVLIKSGAGKSPARRVQQVSAKLGQDDRHWFFETATHVHRAIRAGVAMPAPEGAWYCSPRWCGYWSRCKGREKPHSGGGGRDSAEPQSGSRSHEQSLSYGEGDRAPAA